LVRQLFEVTFESDEELEMADSKTDFAMPGGGRIKLYKREHLSNQYWYARIKVPNAPKYKVLSTKTAILVDAKPWAKSKYNELCLQVMAGGSLVTRTFKQVFEQWKNHEANGGTTKNGGSWESTIERIESYALGYFGPKRIDQIGEAEFTDYWNWRRHNFNKKPPSNDTLRRERTCILPVFKFALSKGYIMRVPETNAPKSRGKRRATFTGAEWERLKKASHEWVKDSIGLATHRDRFVASNYFHVLAETGLRIGELRELRWKDLFEVEEKDENGQSLAFLACRVDGKTGEREVIFQPVARICVGGMHVFRTGELRLDNPEVPREGPDEDEPVFCHPDGRPIKEFKHSFQSLLKFAEVPIHAKQGPRSPYSFRHLYATKRLSQETSPFLLAKQMGTSVEMLEKHYGQVMTPTVARQITKSEPFNIKFSI
jgi:integrase